MGKRLILILLVFSMMFSLGCSSKSEPVAGQAPKEETSEPQEVIEEEPKFPPMIQAEKALPGALIVSIDNERGARPQSGLDQADRVYEIMAEGGITRFLAIYHSREVEKIGPIRSARYYFTYIAKGHDFPFAHAGGSAQALSLINQLKIKDLDEIYNAGRFFYRAKDRRMPHNLYSSTELLVKGAEAKKFKMLPLKPLPQGVASGGQEADLMDITYSNQARSLYTVTYEWDGHRYKRYINGTPHKTLEGGEIFTENVIVLAAKTRDIVTDQLRSEIDIIGKGEALYFTNGQVYKGTWEKPKAEVEFAFLYEGKPMEFVGEHAWINVVGSLNMIEYKKMAP